MSICRGSVACALLLFGAATSALPVDVRHNFDVLRCEVSLRFSALQDVHSVRTQSGELVLSISTPEAGSLRGLLSSWKADPLLQEIRVDRQAGDTLELAIRHRQRPASALRWERRANELILEARLIQPADAGYYREAGCYLASVREFDAALAQLRKALALDPQDLRPYLDLAEIWAQLGQKDLAAAAARSAMRDPQLRARARALVTSLQGGKPGHPGTDVSEEVRRERSSPDSSRKSATEMRMVAESNIGRGEEPPPDVPSTPSASPRPNSAGASAGEDRSQILSQARVRVEVIGAAALLAAGLMAPIGVVTLHLRRRRRKMDVLPAGVNDQERVDLTGSDVFQLLLAERLSRKEATGLEPAKEEEAGEEVEPAGLFDSVEPAPAPAGKKAGRGSETAGASVRGQLESVLALADRGFSVEEIARRLQMGKEEVRLALQVRRSKPSLRVPQGDRRGLRLQLVEE